MHGSLLVTPLPRPLGVEGRATVAFLRGPAPHGEKADRAYRFIYAMAEHTLAYHFNEPLARLGVGSVTRMAVEVALQIGLAGVRLPLRRVLSGLEDDQYVRVADEIEKRLRSDPARTGEGQPATPAGGEPAVARDN
jgi:hypothetical protein